MQTEQVHLQIDAPLLCIMCFLVEVSWRSNKYYVVARSSVEAEYRAMTSVTCELIWLKHLLQELRFRKDEQMKLICDNQAASTLHPTRSFMRGPNILKWIVTSSDSSERRSHKDA